MKAKVKPLPTPSPAFLKWLRGAVRPLAETVKAHKARKAR